MNLQMVPKLSAFSKPLQFPPRFIPSICEEMNLFFLEYSYSEIYPQNIDFVAGENLWYEKQILLLEGHLQLPLCKN